MTLVSVLVGAGSPAHATSFVFSTFTGDAIANETLSIYKSPDALNFSLVSNTGFSGPTGALRDPSIVRYADGKYYVAYTDPIGAGCCGKEDHFSISSSTDLIHWTNLTTVPGGVPGLAHVWAPEWFIDGSTVMIIANIDTQNTDSDFKPYLFTALNSGLTSWSAPATMQGIEPNYIDTFALKVGATYHVFTKNEATRYVEHATAPKMTGPWTFVGRADWAGWGSGMEGPTVVALDDGTWRIYLDGQGAVGFLYSNSPDLMTWSKRAALPGITDTVRHGTVIRDVSVGGGGGAGAVGGASAMGGTTGNGGAGGAGGGAGSAGTAQTGGSSGAAGGSVATGGTGVTGAGGSFANDASVATDGSRGAGDAAATGQGMAARDGGCDCAVSQRRSAGAAETMLGGLVFVTLVRSGRRRRKRSSLAKCAQRKK